MVLWAYSSKRGKFHCFTVTVRVRTVSRISRVRVTFRVSVMTRFSFSDRAGIRVPDVKSVELYPTYSQPVMISFSALHRYHTTPQPFYGPFSRTNQVSQCQKRTSGRYGTRED